MRPRQATRLSKYLSLHLRHAPDQIGITLDAQGWTSVETLIAQAAAHGFPFTREELARVVADSDKRRFTLDGDRIRANQGHTVPVDLGLEFLAPPERLYHGTVDRFLPAIRTEGLRPMKRHAVHLSADPETATRVGARRGEPVVLTVRAGVLHRAGHRFQRSANGVWLTDSVPPEALEPLEPGPAPTAGGAAGDRSGS
ncbi:RNA 2'-phosphotransferase [Streptomyces sp. NPDC005438]|uniref:RNA 2'-phosphotransferase n=1 Tax=Streptomyces sp. NPDC005438 TaxID=3156880 RepID=UPI0033B8A5EC